MQMILVISDLLKKPVHDDIAAVGEVDAARSVFTAGRDTV